MKHTHLFAVYFTADIVDGHEDCSVYLYHPDDSEVKEWWDSGSGHGHDYYDFHIYRTLRSAVKAACSFGICIEVQTDPRYFPRISRLIMKYKKEGSN